jgi:hypothetical protein
MGRDYRSGSRKRIEQVARSSRSIWYSARKLPLIQGLMRLIVTDNQALRDQIIALEQGQRALRVMITDGEAALNELPYGLYGVCENERRIIEQA